MRYISSKHIWGKTRTGFTLVEMIVSLAVFSIVAVVALGAMVKIVSANRKAQSLQASITNLNFALDAMSRELRTGSTYFCESNNGAVDYKSSTLDKRSCTGGSVHNENNDATIAFIASDTIKTGTGSPCSAAHAYRFRHNTDGTYTLMKAVQTSCDTGISNTDFEKILDDAVNVVGYYLSVDNAEYQRATIRISGYAGAKEREKTYFDVQSTISSRSNN